MSCEGSAKIRIGGRTVSREFSLTPDQDEIALQLWDKDLKAVIRVPKLGISLSGENAFLLNDAMWVGDIDKAAFLSIHHPNDLVASVQLGGYAVPRTSRKNVYDLGNFLASKSTWTSNSLPLGIILRRNDVIVDEVLLTQIIFHPFFSETPVLEKDKKLLWAPEDKYYGPPTSEFYVKLYHGMGEPDPYTYFETLKSMFSKRNSHSLMDITDMKSSFVARKLYLRKKLIRFYSQSSFVLGTRTLRDGPVKNSILRKCYIGRIRQGKKKSLRFFTVTE